MSYRFLVLASVSVAICASPARGETSRSAGPAQRLLETLQQKQLRHAAAKDPSEPGRYVAAMLVGEGQLLVVSARYAQPVLMNERLFRGDYEGVYRELNAAGEREGKMFVQDLGRPGPGRQARRRRAVRCGLRRRRQEDGLRCRLEGAEAVER